MRARNETGRRGGERGAALLVVIVSVAILTALAADLAYESRVSLEIAAGARDELRATYLAKSGVALSRMVLGFQQQIDDAASAACGLASGIGPRAPGQRGRGGAPAQQPAPPCPRPQIWSAVPVGSALVQSLFGGGAPAETRAAATAEEGAAGGEGLDLVAHLHGGLAAGRRDELGDRHLALGLVADVDDGEVLRERDDGAGDDLALLDGTGLRLALGEERREVLGLDFGRTGSLVLHSVKTNLCRDHAGPVSLGVRLRTASASATASPLVRVASPSRGSKAAPRAEHTPAYIRNLGRRTLHAGDHVVKACPALAVRAASSPRPRSPSRASRLRQTARRSGSRRTTRG